MLGKVILLVMTKCLLTEQELWVSLSDCIWFAVDFVIRVVRELVISARLSVIKASACCQTLCI